MQYAAKIKTNIPYTTLCLGPMSTAQEIVEHNSFEENADDEEEELTPIFTPPQYGKSCFCVFLWALVRQAIKFGTRRLYEQVSVCLFSGYLQSWYLERDEHPPVKT